MRKRFNPMLVPLPGGQWDGKKRNRDGEGDGGKEEYLIFHIYIPDCQLI